MGRGRSPSHCSSGAIPSCVSGMICDVDSITVPFGKFADELKARGKEKDLVVHVMHEDIFNSMHRI